MKKCVRTVQRYINELIRANLIKKKRRGSISNIYEIIRKTAETKIEEIKEKAAERYAAHENTSKKRKSLFCNYEQRKYNPAKLEALLLGAKNITYEDCLIK